ncbi:MAG: sigma-54-dependent Fis family transcriptional regulator, partial [Bdellovibrionales bacterium]|nr:sigma-54-dependent Fis family transcriptional regulator [Bdellovibrionales bacterium]
MSLGYLICTENINNPLPIKDFITIGSSISNNIIVQQADQRHCRIAVENENFMVRDLNSHSGTFVNGARVQHAYLTPGDRLYVADRFFIFSDSVKTESIQMLCKSKNTSWQSKLNQLPNLARTEHPLLILGESGSGKEVIARQVHKLSNRSFQPFISVNCSALSESLIESELFGHKKGSFTGAESDRSGAFLAANGGTLFLDEIGDLPLSLQPKLLRAIENQEVKAVGSDVPRKVDVRIITANH